MPISVGSLKSKRVPEKHLLLLYYVKAFECVDHNKLWKILKEMGIPYLPPEKICMQVKKQQLELGVEQQTDSK